MKIQRALISVSDKTGVVEFAASCMLTGWRFSPREGRRKTLQAEGIPTVEVSQFTGSPEILDGRVKTLHPKIHGGLLFIRGDEEHERQAAANGIKPIDLVVVNLYPFEATIAKEDVTLAEAIEQIDIGGPSMIRSAAKNYQSVTVVTDPADYSAVIESMKEEGGGTSLAVRERLAIKAFTTHPPTIARSRATSTRSRKPRRPSAWSCRWSSASATVRIRTSTPSFTGISARTLKSSRARSSPITISSISARPRRSSRSLPSPRSPSSSIRIPAASAPIPTCARPGTRPSPRTSRRPLAASSSATVRSISPWPRASRKSSAR